MLHDVQYNVLAVVAPSGRMVERYEYTPYGERTVFTHGWMLADVNQDGVVDASDQAAVAAAPGSDESNICDLDGDGDVDSADGDIVDNYINETLPIVSDPLVTYPTEGSFRNRGIALGSANTPLNEFGHQGLYHDEESGLVQNRERMRSTALGKWTKREPLGYVDGLSLHQYIQSNPVAFVDPLGNRALPCLGQACGSGMRYQAGMTLFTSYDDMITWDIWWDDFEEGWHGVWGYWFLDDPHAPTDQTQQIIDAASNAVQNEGQCFARCEGDALIDFFNILPVDINVFEEDEPWIGGLQEGENAIPPFFWWGGEYFEQIGNRLPQISDNMLHHPDNMDGLPINRPTRPSEDAAKKAKRLGKAAKLAAIALYVKALYDCYEKCNECD